MISIRVQALLIILVIGVAVLLYAQADSDRLTVASFSQGVDEKGVPKG